MPMAMRGILGGGRGMFEESQTIEGMVCMRMASPRYCERAVSNCDPLTLSFGGEWREP